MKYSFILLYFLLVPAIFSVAQPSGKMSMPKNGQSSVSGSHKPTDQASKSNTSANTVRNNVTGIWKGYFVQNTLSFLEDKYRFEVQVAQQDDKSMKGVTYSYKTTVFYGKADATGIYTASSKNFLLKEIKLTDIKVADQNTGACLMTCYLDYDKAGNMESLSGTYTSVSIKDKSDCGSGKVYLEKRPVSDFYKEDFVLKRENELKKKDKVTGKKDGASPSVAKNKTTKTTIIKPGAENNIVATHKPLKTAPEPTLAPEPKTDQAKIAPPQVKIFPRPDIMKTRDNELLKTIETSEKEFKIELYDNGEIDGDKISVYHNNELIVSNKMLTDKPITFNIHADENSPVHDFVMVAENLGSIPPNTALMIITAGSQRFELFVTSNEQKNAVVRVEYKPGDVSKN